MVTDATVSGARQCSYCRSGFKSRRSPTLIDDGALVEGQGAGSSILKTPVRVRHALHLTPSPSPQRRGGANDEPEALR